MKLSDILLWALSATAVAAGPVAAGASTASTRTHVHPTCKGTALAALRKNDDHRSFCNTFLRQTKTNTVTAPTVTTTVRMTRGKQTVTATITKKSVVYVKTTPVSTVTTTSFSSAAISCASSAGFFPGQIAGGSGAGGDVKEIEKRHAPISTPSAVSGLPSATISSLCSCLQITAQTVTRRTTIGKSTSTVYKTIGPAGASGTTTVRTTVTNTVTLTNTAKASTSTVTYVEPVPTTFNGLNWYAYPNSYDFSGGSPYVDPSLFDSPNYEDSGTVNNPVTVAPGSQATCSLPGSTKQLNCQQITVVMQAYFYAPANGTYTLSTGGSDANAVDNWVGLWTGDNAYSNYKLSNADWIAVREDHSTIQQGGSATYQFVEGELVPVTLIYINGGYAGNFQFQVTLPDGSVKSDTSDFWIPACASSNLFSP